jgi:AcrR family transcriptional regulator
MAKTATKSRKEEILKTTRFLFKVKGYVDTSMRDIARNLDMQQSSIYTYFESKEEMLYTICSEIADAFFELQERVQEMDGDAEAKLRETVKGHVRIITDNLDASGVFIHEWRYMNDKLVKEFIKKRNAYEQFIRQLIRQGKSQGTFKNVDEKFTALMLLSSLNWIYNWYNPRGNMTPEMIGEKLNQLLLTGLLKT